MDVGTALGIAVIAGALQKNQKPKAEMHWQADYPAEDVFDAMGRVADKAEQFLLCDSFPAERKMLLKCKKTGESKGQEIMVLIEEADAYTCEIFMISQSIKLENDHGKNEENLRVLSDLLLEEYVALSNDEEYETLRMFHLGYLSEEEYRSIIETERWWKESRMEEFSLEIMKKENR